MTTTHHIAFFGDKTYTFRLTPPMVVELQHLTGVGIAALYHRVMNAQFHLTDLIETIRLGLIGGGLSPVIAQRLIDAYAYGRPIMEIFPLAADILDAAWSGTPDPDTTPALAGVPQADDGQAPASGDMAAAINDALLQVAP